MRIAIDHVRNARPAARNIVSVALGKPAEAVDAAVDALEHIGSLLSAGCFARPETLTRDNITAYALALLQVRECAVAAEMPRLSDACDALAVTVSRLIDDHQNASLAACDALSRFVGHAHAIVERSVSFDAASVSVPADAGHDVYASHRDDFSRMFAPLTRTAGTTLPV